MRSSATQSDLDNDFDHLDPSWIADPFPIWDEMRQNCPVAHTDKFNGVYFPTRYEDVRAIAYDTEHFSSRRLVVQVEPMDPPLIFPPITSDPPAHRAHRKLLLPLFTPDAIKRHEPHARAVCQELIGRLTGNQSCDGAADYARHIPVRIIAQMLGVPNQDADLFRRWIRELLELGITDPQMVAHATEEMCDYFAHAVDKRRKAPANDMITFLLRAEIDGQPLSNEHIVGTLRLLLIAGIDTTWSAIGACLWHLATHAQDRHRLVSARDLIPTAVEEFLRAYAPVTMAREVIKETKVGGCPVHPGQMVMLSFPAANRDPSVFEHADRVVIDRQNNGHVAFGLGIHRCIGSNLARMEIVVALQEWLAAFPQFELAPDAVVTWSMGTTRGPQQLPLRLG
ncbi:MAG: cytochrome P450 [Xanthobacteraceae bacterium]|nr:cytochrome P450 [Xanthobacteraceae bacterium]